MTGMVPPPPNYPPMVPTVPAPPVLPSTTKARTVKRQQRRTPRPAPRADRHPRLRAVAYNASAAACGWWCGLGPWALNGMTYYGTGDTPRGVWVGVGLTLISLLIEAKTHGWRSTNRPALVQAAGWAARIPLATTLLALALYGPDATL